MYAIRSYYAFTPAPAIEAAVAQVHGVESVLAQDHGRQGGEQRLGAMAGAQPVVLALQHLLERAVECPLLGTGVVVRYQGVQGGAGSQLTIQTLADTVGNGHQPALGQLRSYNFV